MVLYNEDTVVAQLVHDDTVYMTGATGMPVQDDLDDRVAMANASHTAKTNAELSTGLNKTSVSGGAINADVYDGGNVVTPVNATWFEAQVRLALDADALFDTGGPYTSDYSVLSPYVDSLVLIEGSKLTGERFF
jgi:hypothetical protein